MNFDDLATLPNTQASSEPSREQKRRAVAHAFDHARDKGDFKDLVDALGLLPSRPKPRRASVPATTTADCPINTTTGGTP
ncbi:hypothetical protein WKI71_36800 [Streptomyces sp. MS1.AVA.1]|uniref:Uncharacterized protein n=1 Tax=Streptomyces machairae TaxID=3134109 RepID=A0ABU8USQ2_9ACTN